MPLNNLFGLLGHDPAPKLDAAGTAATQEQYNNKAFDQNKLAANRTTDSGSSIYGPNGVTTTLNPAFGFGSYAGNMGLLGGNLPTSIDYASAVGTPGMIADRNFGAYAAMTAPMRDQQTQQMNVDLTNRGIPVGSEVWNNQQGNQQRAFSIADTNAAAQAWNAVPGMQATMTDTAYKQGATPFQLAGANMGLLQGFNSLAPQAGQVQTGPVNYADLAKTAYQGDVASHNAEIASDNAVLGAGATALGMWAGGGFPGASTAFNWGKGLFNGSSGGVDTFGNPVR